MPPKITLEQAKGFSVYMMRAILNGARRRAGRTDPHQLAALNCGGLQNRQEAGRRAVRRLFHAWLVRGDASAARAWRLRMTATSISSCTMAPLDRQQVAEGGDEHEGDGQSDAGQRPGLQGDAPGAPGDTDAGQHAVSSASTRMTMSAVSAEAALPLAPMCDPDIGRRERRGVVDAVGRPSSPARACARRQRSASFVPGSAPHRCNRVAGRASSLRRRRGCRRWPARCARYPRDAGRRAIAPCRRAACSVISSVPHSVRPRQRRRPPRRGGRRRNTPRAADRACGRRNAHRQR